jgi:hypothetical protein
LDSIQQLHRNIAKQRFKYQLLIKHSKKEYL